MIGRLIHVYRKFHTDWLLNNTVIVASNDTNNNNNNNSRHKYNNHRWDSKWQIIEAYSKPSRTS